MSRIRLATLTITALFAAVVVAGYVMEGDLTLLVEGKPPLALKPGDSYQIPLNAIHDARSGEKGAKVLAVYIVERGKPLATPAP